jgi:hypothetical protein
MRTLFLRVCRALPLMGFLLACSGEDGSGSNPLGPVSVPTISAVEPAAAAPGDRITIRGEFGAQAGRTAVTINGVDTEVKSRSVTGIVAIVPELPPGTFAVVVTVGDRSSTPFAFRVSPVMLPLITGIEPARARPGERITITGSNLESPRVTVTVGGKTASVMAASPTAVVVVVPDVAPGTMGIVLTARDRRSNEVAYEILQAKPVIVGVAPNPTRADLALTITGRYLDGGELQVIMDGSPVEVQSRNGAQILARLPVATRIGNRSLEVLVGEERSAPFAFEVDDFSVTGTYVLLAVVVSVGQRESRLCPILPEKGTLRNLSSGLVDNRPRLEAVVGDANLIGKVDSKGRFSATSPSRPLRISGSVARRLDGERVVYEIDMTVDHLGIFGICGWQERAKGTRK